MKKKISALVAFVLLLSVGSVLFYKVFNQEISLLKWDVFGYYLYLPLLFIYHDLGMKDISIIQDIIQNYEISSTFYQAHVTETGNWLIRYPMGEAVLFFPFFILAHLYTLATGGLADGFSHNYEIAIAIGCFTYTILGVVVLRKVLLRFFSDKLTALLLALLFLATNFLHIVSVNIDTPHNQLFFLYTLILWFTIRWHETHKFRHSIFLAICCGLAMLCRPSEVVVLIIPLLWGVYNLPSLKEKIRLLLSNKLQIVIFFCILLCIGLPQFIYWKVYAGQFLYNSYHNPGEGFDLLSPHTANFLFSFRKGWYIYTPIMLLATIGFWGIYKKNKPIFAALFLFFLANIFLLSSWTCWWYAGSFSQRSLVQSYPVMMIALGYFFLLIKDRKIWLKTVVAILVTAMTALNLFQIWQANHGILDGSRMTRAYYWKIFGKTKINEEDKKLLLIDRPSQAIIKELDTDSYNYKNPELLTFAGMGDHDSTLNYLQLTMPDTYSPSVHRTYKEITSKDYLWLRASVLIYPLGDIHKTEGALVVTTEYKGRPYGYRALDLSSEELIPNQWNKIYYYYVTPELRSKKDDLKIYYWHRSNEPVLLDSLKVEYYEPKGSN